jgi:hypothetical protein
MKFCKVPVQLDLDLARAGANGATWAMSRAISEAWYRNGYRHNHPDSFPLKTCDFEKWGISKLQKHRSLRFLIKLGWIEVDRKDPTNPIIIMTRPAAFAFHPGNASPREIPFYGFYLFYMYQVMAKYDPPAHSWRLGWTDENEQFVPRLYGFTSRKEAEAAIPEFQKQVRQKEALMKTRM